MAALADPIRCRMLLPLERHELTVNEICSVLQLPQSTVSRHLKTLADRPWWIAAVLSWGVAFFEYMLQVPANRIGFGEMSLPQLKMLQEIITLVVFVPFAILYMKQRPHWDFAWAGLCVVAAIYFVFRAKG